MSSPGSLPKTSHFLSGLKILSLKEPSPLTMPLDFDGLIEEFAQRVMRIMQFLASSFVTVRIHLKLGSPWRSFSIEGLSRNASILPNRYSIFLRVVGFLRAFSKRVSHLRLPGRLFLQFESIWSTTNVGSGGSP